MINFYVRVLRLPVLLVIPTTLAAYCFVKGMSIGRDATVMGLLSQFDGTATTVFVALATFRTATKSDAYGKSARMWRRTVQIQFAATFALVSFVLATAAAHYPFLGAWAIALNVTTVAAILWGLAGTTEPT